ncbi:hypothetical protein UFOVP1417_34 [uncultured Caudovirales phage]|uniref:Uncharacterized protein n=1 Tax=uncultured Caudovirales phage TaxID=2100421 RepID=A0A6J5SAM7_9CAUD|nr:hypothetical protein UFOVP664_53 [uncultured Caudovirales phage]CAB4195543.1 hypothetical protein UFOVP1303_20 [uncultured Caudovirales phage]CAB4210691.1 hypothetical protein UFOVP1417_34 [uncultured Caudovirales phage]CAB5226940.1 hypothetical protein UFOVP1517_77 [uncultured Caudovirales phage]
MQKLRDRIEELEEEIRQLRADIAPTEDTFTGVLTRQQVALLKSIRNRKIASYQYIDQVLAGQGNFGRGDGQELEQLRSKVAIYNLRQRLKPYGIEIKTWRGVGYYLDDENKAKLKELMEKKGILT